LWYADAQSTRTLTPVTLQLKWKHQFQFAGYYAALERGYYEEVGLDVTIVQAEPGIDPVYNVLEGRADFGVGTSELMLLHARGEPVVVLAVIFQHSPLVLLTLEDSDIQSLHDLVGKRVMIEPMSAELFAYFALENIPVDRLEIQDHTFSANALLRGETDAISAYVTDEPFELREAGRRYHVYSPRAAGIDFYGDNLFTTRRMLREHPERVRAFREASLRGWEYAMQHPEELARLIHDEISQRHSLDHLRFEAMQMERLLLPDLVEIGYMHEGRWRHIAEVYTREGMMPDDYSMD